MHDEKLKSIEEKLEELNKQSEVIKADREVAETKAREVAQVRLRARTYMNI